MIYKLFELYFRKLPNVFPLGYKVLQPYDHHLYLYQSGKELFVVIEEDYLDNMPWHAKEIEEAFNVKVQGWCVPIKYQVEVGSKLMAPDASDEGFINGEGPRRVLTYDNGMYYGLLRVAQKKKQWNTKNV